MGRKLRIGVSVFFGLVAVVLLALWLRSRTTVDVAGISPTASCWLAVASSAGELELSIMMGLPPARSADWYGFSSVDLPKTLGRDVPRKRPQFGWSRTPHELRIKAPTLVFAVAAALCVGIPWMPFRRRFSLLTLLIVTTLFAVVLGLGVWLGS